MAGPLSAAPDPRAADSGPAGRAWCGEAPCPAGNAAAPSSAAGRYVHRRHQPSPHPRTSCA